MNTKKIDEKKQYTVFLFSSLIGVLVGGFLFFQSIQIWQKNENQFMRFVITFISVNILSIWLSQIISFLYAIFMKFSINRNINEKYNKIHQFYDTFQRFMRKVYLVSFGIFWFGFLIAYDYISLKNWNSQNIIGLLLSLLFWKKGISYFRKKWKSL